MTFESSLYCLTNAKSASEVWSMLQDEARRLGMTGVSWVARLPRPDGEYRVITYDNFGNAWRERYFSQNYLTVDPTVKRGLNSVMPLVWADTHAEAYEFWEDARSYGLREGIAQSTWDPKGCASMLSLCRDGLELSPLELADKMPKLCWLTHLAHSSMMHHLAPIDAPELGSDLSERERDCLKWASQGKTSSEIAATMHLTKRTIDFHLENARTKLLADNRTDAVARAIRLSLI